MSHSDEIRKMLLESGIDPDANWEELETLACAVADAFKEYLRLDGAPAAHTPLVLALARLDTFTAFNPKRKVRS